MIGGRDGWRLVVVVVAVVVIGGGGDLIASRIPPGRGMEGE